MNFLSHFYFNRDTVNPELVLGCVLPDLVKNANKTWNIHPEKKGHFFNESPKLQSILIGWQRHLDIDRYFHSSDFFMEHTKAIRTAVAPVLLNSEVRPSFFAHIALELMLDSLLLKLKIINAFQFYDLLAQSERATIQLFLELNLITDTPRFFKFFDQFLEINYLHSYNQSENIVYALNRICMRVWNDPLNAEQRLQLSVVLPEYYEKLEPCFMDIFDDLNRHIN